MQNLLQQPVKKSRAKFRDPYRIYFVLFAPILCALLLTTGCKTIPVGKYQVVEFDRRAVEESLCGGIFEYKRAFENGSGQATTFYYELANRQRVNDHLAFVQAESAREIAHMRAESARKIAYIKMKSDQLIAQFKTLPEDQQLARTKILLDELFRKKPDPREEAQLRMIDERLDRLDHGFAEYDQKAGHQPFVKSSKIPIKRSYLAPRKVGALVGIHSNHTPQLNPYTCWAASLQTAFQYLGYPYTQEQFLASFKASCPRKRSGTASLNQMLFAASNVYTNGRGIWIEPPKSTDQANTKSNLTFYFKSPSDYGFAQILMPFENQAMMPEIPMFHIEKKWASTISLTEGQPVRKGKIKIIETTAEFIQAVSDKNVVIVGRRTPNGGHTVVISGITYLPGGNYNAATDTYEMDHRARLEQVSYLDPSTVTIPDPENGNKFLSEMVFAFYIERPR